MPCTSPLFRVPEDSHNFFLLSEYDRVRCKNGGVLFFGSKFFDDYKNVPGFNEDEIQILPCGQCASCRLARSKEWAIRCSLESEMHEFNYFVTLTYDDFHLPSSDRSFIDYEGNVWDSNLCRRDVQLFLKKLRKWESDVNNNQGIKVFYCGEYGDLNGRPHYHLCLFGVSQIPDLVSYRYSGNFTFYKSALYDSFWSVSLDGTYNSIPRGFVDISELSFDTVAYTARYVMKKQGGKIAKDFLNFYHTLDKDARPELRLQPFVGMSLKPGIASEYYELNKHQIREEDVVKYTKKFKLYSSKPPRYFDKIFDREDPDGFALVKEKRIHSGIASRRSKSSLFSESSEERLKRENDIILDREKRIHVRSL